MPMETGRQHPPAERNRERATYKMIQFWQEEYIDFRIAQTKPNSIKINDLSGECDRVPTAKPAGILLFKVSTPILLLNQGILPA